MALETATGLATEQRAIASLRPHPANYRRHPERQLLILRESLRVHGQQKPVVITLDGTILAGHGLVEAARLEGWTQIGCHVYDGPYPEAFLAMDNRSADLAEDDPQALAGLLKALDDQGQLGLAGYETGELEKLLAELQSGMPEMGDEWHGMPEFLQEDLSPWKTLLVHFATLDDLVAFSELVGQKLTPKTRFIWYPQAAIEHSANKRYSHNGP